MRKIWLVLLVLVGIMMLMQGCTKRWEEEEINYMAPNWTSDGKIVFVEEKIIWKYEKPWLLDVNGWQDSKNIWLCEINSDGTGKKRIANIFNDVLRSILSTSSAGDYVVTGEDKHKEIWVIKRDGTGLQKVGEGTYPDFSPDAERIVYQKKDQGIWIMNRDGSADHQIISDGQHPAWSSEGGRIAYTRSDSSGIWIADTSGSLVHSWKGDSIVYPVRGVSVGYIDWGPPDSNTVITEGARISPQIEDGFIVLYLDSLQKYVFTPVKAYVYRWSPDGIRFSARDSGGYFITTFGSNYSVNFDNKWYLKP